MLNNNIFYFNTIQNLVQSFGWIFSDIHIQRPDGKTLKIPIEFSEKQKWYQRLVNDPNAGDTLNQRSISLILPRMGYEMKGFKFDPSRKKSTTNFRVGPSGHTGTALKQLNGIPMTFDFDLYLQTNNLEDGWQIIEQILTFFTPDWNIDVLVVPQLNLRMTVPITLVGSQFEDKYEGNLTDKRILEWTFSFEAKSYLYPAIKEKPIITNAMVDITDNLLHGSIPNFSSTLSIEPQTTQIDSIDFTITETDHSL